MQSIGAGSSPGCEAGTAVAHDMGSAGRRGLPSCGRQPDMETTTHESHAIRHPKAFVTESLSHGLALRAIGVLSEQGDKYWSSLMSILRRRTGSKKAVRQAVAGLRNIGERAKLIQVIGSTPNERLACVWPFVPSRIAPCEQVPGGGVAFDAIPFHVSVRGIFPGDSQGALAVAEHALERLYQRMNTLDLDAVSDELHDAMLLARPIAIVARHLGLRQLALPTSSGAFLCDVPQAGCVVARTWLSNCQLGPRWTPVDDAVRSAVQASGSERGLATFIARGLDGPLADQSHPLLDNLEASLARFAWLQQAYTTRPDPVGELWAAAREAANQPDAGRPA